MLMNDSVLFVVINYWQILTEAVANVIWYNQPVIFPINASHIFRSRPLFLRR